MLRKPEASAGDDETKGFDYNIARASRFEALDSPFFQGREETDQVERSALVAPTSFHDLDLPIDSGAEVR